MKTIQYPWKLLALIAISTLSVLAGRASAVETYDVPVEKDTMTVVYVDIKRVVMVDDTQGIVVSGDLKTALVVFAFNPEIPRDNEKVLAESGRMAVDCVKKEYRVLSDNLLGAGNTILAQKDVSALKFEPVTDSTISFNVYNWVCNHQKVAPKTGEKDKETVLL